MYKTILALFILTSSSVFSDKTEALKPLDPAPTSSQISQQNIPFSECFLKYDTMTGETEIILYRSHPFDQTQITKETFKELFHLTKFEIKEIMFNETGKTPSAIRVLAKTDQFMRTAPVQQLFTQLLKTHAEVELNAIPPNMTMNVMLPVQKNRRIRESERLHLFLNETETKTRLQFDLSGFPSPPIEVEVKWEEEEPAEQIDPKLKDALQQFQRDADVIRLEHLVYWSGLIEEYHAKKGSYPLQNQHEKDKFAVLVKITTQIQRQFLSPGSPEYNPKLDMNGDGLFTERPVSQWVSELETVLGHEIKERYDIQKAPTQSPVGYYYFAAPEGYLLWSICPTFGVSLISTLLTDGFTPSINIASEGMKANVMKSLTRKEMMKNPIFKEWQTRKLNPGKEAYLRQLVTDNERDSKKP